MAGEKEYLIFKSGRGWYRENSQGYTHFSFDAGRYSLAEAMDIVQPNGPDGSRDGMTYKHQDKINHDYVSNKIYSLQAENQRLREALEGPNNFLPPSHQNAQFKIGDWVKKKSGSEWHGQIVGWYSTKLNPVGWCVESYFEKGSVQIYPEKALIPSSRQALEASQ